MVSNTSEKVGPDLSKTGSQSAYSDALGGMLVLPMWETVFDEHTQPTAFFPLEEVTHIVSSWVAWGWWLCSLGRVGYGGVLPMQRRLLLSLWTSTWTALGLVPEVRAAVRVVGRLLLSSWKESGLVMVGELFISLHAWDIATPASLAGL